MKKYRKVLFENYDYYNINIDQRVFKLPFSIKILLENVIRNIKDSNEEDDNIINADIEALLNYQENAQKYTIDYRPIRILMQDFTGVPAVVDLAAMRDALEKIGGDAEDVNPKIPVDLIIDHSVEVDKYGSNNAFKFNVEQEVKRNIERYKFLKWGQESFANFRVVPPGTGICHQVNLEYLAKIVWEAEEKEGRKLLFPDTLVGTDSHTTMINALTVLGWGVGGIEAEAVMLGEPIAMLIPEVIGVNLSGELPAGATATDLVLTITNLLRTVGVVGKFVEFFGEGLKHLDIADRATIANMAPECGSTCNFFPVDEKTLEYLRLTGRPEGHINIVEKYAKAQGLWHNYEGGAKSEAINYNYYKIIDLNLKDIVPTLAGPRRPQDKVDLAKVKDNFNSNYFVSDEDENIENKEKIKQAIQEALTPNLKDKLQDGSVVIAAITSCTNTSNPKVMVGAALLAKKAVFKGLKVKPWVKTSLAPGSKVVTEYLRKANLQQYLDTLGFNLVGYGCTTCIGNSGPLLEEVSNEIKEKDLIVAAILSGNRNFEGRIHPQVRANYLASPLLVVAFALCGKIDIDLTTEALGYDQQGRPVFLKDIWPSAAEINHYIKAFINSEMFIEKYADVLTGDKAWQAIKTPASVTYEWEENNSYVKKPPYFDKLARENSNLPDLLSDLNSDWSNIQDARILAIFGDSVTTDHISPAGNIAKNSPAAKYLENLGLEAKDYNSYGSRRGNHEVMVRGTFANIRIKNKIVSKTEGGYTKYFPQGESEGSHEDLPIITIYEAAMLYAQKKTPLVIIAGKEYGSGSSRDWAAKGPKLLGVKAVIAESFERIHRSNLIGMGILPLEFLGDQNQQTLELTGTEKISIVGIIPRNSSADSSSNNISSNKNKDKSELMPGALIKCVIKRESKEEKPEIINLKCAINTKKELQYLNYGGILTYVLLNSFLK